MKTHFPILFALACSLAADAELKISPEMVSQMASLDAGSAEAAFTLKNTGQAAVSIEKVQSSCGCTVAELNASSIAPGESTQLTALFEFGGRQGQQRKIITLTTSEGVYELPFEVTIPAKATVTPRLLRWKLGEPAQPKAFSINLADTKRISLGELDIATDNFELKRMPSETGEFKGEIVPINNTIRGVHKINFPVLLDGNPTVKVTLYLIIS